MTQAVLMRLRAEQLPLMRVHAPDASQRASMVPLSMQAAFVLQLLPLSVAPHT
jgi:hypothetical protein